MNEPKLRFKTDNGEKFPNLEVKRLGDITVPYNVRNKNTLPLEIYSVNNIVGFVPQSEQFDDAGYLRNTDTSIYMIVPPKHFAYNPARIDIGSIGYQYLDHDVQVSSLYEVFKTSDSVDDDFLWMWFHTSYFNHTVKRLQEGGVRLYFYYDKMQETKIGLPSLAEQQKIALLFSELDTLIQSAEKELEGYRGLKQCMLQKMFPKKGEKVPEIRFPEFTGDWEQRKLKDISSLITKGTTPKDKSGTGEVNFIKVENINDFSGDITGTSKISLEEHQGYLKRSQLQEGDILFSIAGTLGRVTSVNKAILPANTNQALSIIRLKEGNLEYVKTCLKGNVVADFIRRNPTIGAQPNLSLEQVSNLEIEMPSEAEQKKIGEYFQNLDSLIASQQQELDGYKELKKGLLQQMFC